MLKFRTDRSCGRCGLFYLCAATRRTTASRFDGANKGTHKLPIYLRGDCIHVHAFLAQKTPRILDLIDAGRFARDFVEAYFRELIDIFVILKRTGNAADPKQHTFPNFGGYIATNDYIRNRETTARFQDAISFAKYAVFVTGKVYYAVADYYIDRVIGQWDIFDFALQEFNVLNSGFALVLPRKREHLVSHIEPICFP